MVSKFCFPSDTPRKLRVRSAKQENSPNKLSGKCTPKRFGQTTGLSDGQSLTAGQTKEDDGQTKRSVSDGKSNDAESQEEEQESE